MGLAVWAFAVRTGVAMRAAAEALGVPSPLLPLVVATVPSTASATFALLWSPCAVDSAVGAVSVAMCVCPLAVLAAVAVIVPRRLQQRRSHEQHSPPATSSRLPRAFLTVRVALLTRRVRWDAAAAAPSGCTLRWERVATVVVLEYAAVWYACVDMAVLTVAGLLGAVGQLESAVACRGSAVAVFVLYACQLALCAAVRPFTTLFSNGHALFTLALTKLSVACQVWYLFASRVDGADLGSLGRLLTAAAVCDLIVSGVGWLRWLVDCCDVLRACVRHAQTMLQPVAPPVTLNPECVDHCDMELRAAAANVAALDLASEDPLWSSDGMEEALMDVSDGELIGIVTAQEEAERAQRTAPSDLVRHYGVA